jgi:superfamily II DNA or RNA helicase
VSTTELSTNLLAELAGWEAMKQARSLLAADRVLSSAWQPPLLRGTVREGAATFRAGLVIKGRADAENICSCRDSRQRGIICAHSVAVGLHALKAKTEPAGPVQKPPGQTAAPKPAAKASRRALQRVPAGEAGEPLEIFLILPPNLQEAIARGKVMLYLEGAWRNRCAPLNALPLDVPFAPNYQDAALLEALETLNGGDTPAMVMLQAGQFGELLPKLIGHPRISLGKGQSLEVSSEPVTPAVRATLEPNGEILLELADSPFQVQSATPGRRDPSLTLLRGATTIWSFADHTLRPFGLPHGLEEVCNAPTRISRARVPLLLSQEWPQLISRCNVQANFALEDFTLEPATPTFKLHLTGGIATLQAKLECFYGDKPLGALQNEAAWSPDPASPTVYCTRDPEAEQEAIARLVRSGFTGPDAQGLYHLKDQNRVLSFFAREYPRLENEWAVTLEERLERSTQQNLERLEPRFQITPSGEQWFDLAVAYTTGGGERFAAADIQRLLLSGQSHTRLKNGKFALLDTGAVEELQQVLLDCAPQQHAGAYRLRNTQAGFLDATLRQQSHWHVLAPADWKQRAAQQRGEVKLQPPPLGALGSVLRPYQKEGVAWLHFLRANGFGGILADEMGLGKTLQVLALLSALRGVPDRAPNLVVCPTSVVFNWVSEAAKFTPALRVLALHRPRRRGLFAAIPQHELVVTSYALLRRDAEQYRGLEFDTVVLDEAQHIKNRQTQNAQSVKGIRSRHRLVLTGTPLENSVLDLWSIFDFLMPGYLGSPQDFRERYELPILGDKDSRAQARLARRLRPFMLRRLKREVAADLPAKLEQVSYCELNNEQRALYQQVLEATRRELVNAVAPNGLARTRMVVLTALLRLRQICCDLRLLKLEGAPDVAASALPSGKLELFGELLEEVLDGGHRVLVFSQFTSMLALLREALTAQQIEFCYLDGETSDRGLVVDKFQRDSRIPVFLISLKAGGVGLNLTGADTVIHFDPWWNPAVEAQASDRAHRIGQKRVVTSYKLITRGTVEEKIVNLQTRKRALFQGMLGGEDQLVSSLNWEEIQELLAS